jgi:hypothetical protein
VKCKYCGLKIVPVNPDGNVYRTTHRHIETNNGPGPWFYTCAFANEDGGKGLTKWQNASGQPLTATPMDAGQTEPLIQKVSQTLTLVPKQSGTKVLKFPKPRAKRKKKSTLPEVVGRKFRSVPSGV